MKKNFGVMLFLTLFSAVSVVQSAEYHIRQGDNLTKISELTGHSVAELAQMNDIKNPSLILVDQKITFISKQDIVDTYLWSQKRRTELWPSNPNYKYFGSVMKDIMDLHFRYSIVEPSGLHFDLVLGFAKAQRKAQPLPRWIREIEQEIIWRKKVQDLSL